MNSILFGLLVFLGIFSYLIFYLIPKKDDEHSEDEDDDG